MPPWQRSLIGVALLLALAQLTGVSDGFNRWLSDTHWRWQAKWRPVDFPKDIVVVAIDDKSLQKLGRLRYWSRVRYAQLLERLTQAKVVGIDIVFAEPDERDSFGDQQFADAVRRHGRVVLPFFEWRLGEERPFSAAEQDRVQALLARLPKQQRPTDTVPLTPPLRLQPPIFALLNAASALGYADVNADSDGVYRTPVLLKATPQGHWLPHLALSIACLAQGVSLEEALRDAPEFVRLGERTVRLYNGALPLQPIARRGGSAAAFVRNAVGQPVPTVSFVDALTAPPEQFAGKIVLVGETATGTTDIRPTPLDNSLRGVELLAEVVANLLFLPSVSPLPLAVQWLLIAIAVGLPLWLYSVFPPRIANRGAGIGLVALVMTLESAFWLRWLPSWSPVLLGFVGATALMWLQRFLQEEAQKRQIRQVFSLYVAPEVVEEIVNNPAIAHQEGKRRRVAVLFSDIRNFTAYSEQNPPELVVQQMRTYLTEMAESVQRHRGVLDKFIGDAVMALFGPFLPEDAPISAYAVASALEMLERLERLNKRWVQEGLPPFRIGIGIHVGEAVVGNIGSEQRVQYTALGDTVNLASRLQSLTKELKAQILVSEAVVQEAMPLLADRVAFVDRGTVAIRGREQPVRVYEVQPKVLAEVTTYVEAE